MRVNPYLTYAGQCAEAFGLYAEVFGGKIEFMMTHGQMPPEMPAHPGWEDKVMHAHVRFADQDLMGSDAPPAMYEKPQGFSVSVQIDEPAEAERVFAALSAGGATRMPIQETFWAKRFGMCTDRFGIPWMVNCPKPMEAPAQ